MMKKIFYAAAVFALPVVASAQALNGGVDSIFGYIQKIFNYATILIISLAILYFLWGVVQYVIKHDPEGKERARSQIVYGIIGIVVMVSVWGLVNIIQNALGVGSTDNQSQVPALPTANQ